MLNGVGGRTVAEAKERLSYVEANQWGTYLRQRGSINQGMRIESGFALLAMMLSRINGGKADMSDFMPHFDKPEPVEADIKDVFSLFKKLSAQSKAAANG